MTTSRPRALPSSARPRRAARIESSKVFAKELMAKYFIPTGSAEVFDSYEEAERYVRMHSPPLVVKADGLAAGKGVTVAGTKEEAIKALRECMVERVFGPSGDRVLVEERLSGREVSVFAFVDGETVSPMVAACDYKRAYDDDRGPNTGGMGALQPARVLELPILSGRFETPLWPRRRGPWLVRLPLPGRPLRRPDTHR